MIILCGGRGTRVNSILGDLPKVLVKRNGIEHLLYLIDDNKSLVADANIYLATGFGHEKIEKFVKNNFINVKLTKERKLLGTGGAIKFCMDKFDLSQAYVLNGDTIYTNMDSVLVRENVNRSTVFLTFKKNRERYGSIDVFGEEVKILGKGSKSSGWVNSGFYFLKREIFDQFPKDFPFSFEEEVICCDFFDFIPKNLQFSDFGIPKDLRKYTDAR